MKIGEKTSDTSRVWVETCFILFFAREIELLHLFCLFERKIHRIEIENSFFFSYIAMRMIENENEREKLYKYFDFDMNLYGVQL